MTLCLVIILLFFLAPVVFWKNDTPPIPPAYFRTPGLALPVYRSFGCAIFGVGDLYSPGADKLGGNSYPAFGFSFGCAIPYPGIFEINNLENEILRDFAVAAKL